jgi:hypothetical protein
VGEPRLNFWGFVGGIVIHEDIEPFGDLSIDLFEEVQELGRPVVFDATGARLRSVPFTPEKVKAALAQLQPQRG